MIFNPADYVDCNNNTIDQVPVVPPQAPKKGPNPKPCNPRIWPGTNQQIRVPKIRKPLFPPPGYIAPEDKVPPKAPRALRIRRPALSRNQASRALVKNLFNEGYFDQVFEQNQQDNQHDHDNRDNRDNQDEQPADPRPSDRQEAPCSA
ncbi:uncharacterized protein LOC106012722 [Aplysia californica]|uniref:Uncharacterized protein LOC106012722 n=1 Tax=Aplysia californica TaxID=6500 RepID=A0ABM1A6U0_APLCA|nr:uncharacterized protein LOC106012722 [Aplysia californica]